MTLSGYRVAPRQGHLERAKRVYGFLTHFRESTIRFLTDEPDFSDLPEPLHDWDYSVYGKVHEMVPNDCPEPLGQYVTTITYVDANLYHDMLTGRSVTGILLNITVRFDCLPARLFGGSLETFGVSACGDARSAILFKADKSTTPTLPARFAKRGENGNCHPS